MVSWCATHPIAYISRRPRRYVWLWDWQTLVDSGGTRALWSGRAVGIQGYETKEENPLTRGGASFIGQAPWGPKTVLKETPPRRAEKLNFDQRIATNTFPDKLQGFGTMKVVNFQTAAPMKGKLRPRLRATRSDLGKKGIRQNTHRGTGGRGGTSKSRAFDKSVGGPRVKLRRLAPRRPRTEHEGPETSRVAKLSSGVA